MVAESEGILINQGVVAGWGYTNTMYVVPLITFFAEDSLASASDRLMTTSMLMSICVYSTTYSV